MFCIGGQGGSFLLCLADLLFCICLWMSAVHDWRERKIPNYCMSSIGGLALIRGLCDGGYGIYGIVSGTCAAGIPFAVLHVIKPRDLGKADVKLTAAAGAYVGYRCILDSVISGVGIAVFYCMGCLVIGLKDKRKGGEITVPLGSCICIGTIACYCGYFKLHFMRLCGMIN